MSSAPFEELERELGPLPPAERHTRMIERLSSDRELLPYYFKVLEMTGRQQLGLTLIGVGDGSDVPADQKPAFDERFASACREVGDRYTALGDPASAWPYYRSARLTDRMVEAIAGFAAAGRRDDPQWDPQLEAVIEVAFGQGVAPVAGYQLVLDHRGTCDAISMMESHFPFSQDLREECGARLARQLHRELVTAIHKDIATEENTVPDERDVRRLIEGRDFLFERRSYHVDDSHLQAVIRIVSTLENTEIIDLALQMCAYGERLPDSTPDQPPFQEFYSDYTRFLRALLGEDTDAAVAHFSARAEEAGAGRDQRWIPAQIFIYFLDRLGRTREAVDAYRRFLDDCQQPVTIAPTLVRLCEKLGDAQPLREHARHRQDLVALTASWLLEERGSPPPPAD